MKHLKLFFALFAMLALGVTNAWAEEEATLTFDDKAKRTEFSTSKQVWVENGITFTNNKGSSTSNVADYAKPARLYKSSEVIVECSLGNITQIVFDCNTDAYATALKNSISGSTASSDKVTVTCDGSSDEFTISNLSGGQVRIDALTVTYTSSTDGGDDSTPTQLATPTGLTVSDITSSGATLSWNAVANASSYSVTIVDGGSFSQNYSVTETTKIVSGLTPSTGYLWTVTAVGDGTNYTNSEESETGEFTTSAPASGGEEPGTGGESTGTATLTFDNVSKRTTFTTSQQVWTENGVTLTNDKASSTSNVADYCNPARFYKNSKITITHTSNKITQIVFDCKSSSYATALQSAIGNSAAISDDKVTVNITPATESYVINALSGGQVQMDALTVTYETSGSGSTETVLSVSPENITWKGVAASAEKSEEITVTLSNIEAVMAELSGDNPSAFSIDKDLLEASGKIKVSKNTTTIGEYAAILTITDTDTQTKTVALSMEVVADPEPTGTFEKFTGIIEEGDYVLVANETTDALKNTITSNRFDCGTVQFVEDKIVNPDKSVIWHIAANGEYWTMYNESITKYAGGTTSKNQGALLDDVTDLAKWTITVDKGVYTFENYGRSQQTSDSNNKFLSKNNQNAYWATYASGQKNPVLYKKSDGKQPAGLVYETNKYRTKLGDSFVTPTLTNPNALIVTYNSSDHSVAEVAVDGTVTIKSVGSVEITATFAGSETYRRGSASYTIGVTEHAGTQVDPYSVADARRVIDVMETAEGVYATGIVSEIVTAYNATYGNITYNISIDGTTAADQLQAYRGKGVNGENFASADDVKVGDEVVVKGNLKLHNGSVYEFDADNQLVSLKRDKQQAGLAYEEKEHTANVGEDFTEPALTNPNSLTVTYSSSNTALATVDATTGEVSILAAGKVTITASSAADATYAAGSASYNITITDPSLAVATLPFYFDGKKADIEGTAGMTQEGIDSDYNAAPYLKFNTAGDWAIVQFDSEPGEFSFLLKQNGQNAGTFTVYESANGEDYTPIWAGGDLGGNGQSATIEPTLSATARYVKFEYTTKGASTNYGLGSISIQKADHRAEAGIAWNPATVSLTVGDAFTAPTFNNPNGLSGITFASSNEALATVNNAGAITLVSGKTGTATITATFADGHATYKPAEATCVITVSPKSEKVVILAQYNGQWYAMTGAYVTDKTNVLAAIPVEYINGTLYNVAEADKASIEWQRSMNGNKATFKNGDNYLTGGTSTDLTLKTDAFEWDYNGVNYLCNDGKRTFLYCENTKTNVYGFKNYAISNAGSVKNNNDGTTESYSSTPEVVAPVYATATIYTRSVTSGNFGTICLPYASTKYSGAEFFEVAGKETGKVTLNSVKTLVAGTPYIFQATDSKISVVYEGEAAETALVDNGLYGTFEKINDVKAESNGKGYIIALMSDGTCALQLCGDNCWLEPNRAYLVIEEINKTKSPMPGCRRISMDVQGENETTGVEDIITTDAPVKVIENGQLIIIRDGVKYNVQGQRL